MNTNVNYVRSATVAEPRRKLAARIEPFDTYWQAPEDVEAGFTSFTTYYHANYLSHLPADKNTKILVVSCGPGYLVDVLIKAGYTNVVGIDSDYDKLAPARRRSLPCECAEAFPYLDGRSAEYDVIIPEQELNHLTLDETIEFLQMCNTALKPGGKIILYAINGANPIVGSEGASQNIDHFYTVTEYSLVQIMELAGFTRNRPFPLKLYVFYKNPMNYVGLAITTFLEVTIRILFKLYGKKISILSKKIGATGIKPG